ncbi:uncharacterized protein [Dermacentor albipictus]
MEIYNENILDLLDNGDEKHLQIRDNVDGQPVIVDLTEVPVGSKEEIESAMNNGERRRHGANTKANQRSSRSHSIFRMVIESSLKDGTDGAVAIGQLNLVDLAGSERTEKFRESTRINLSLTFLTQVISKLSRGERGHINFRDSKLTRILRNSLGGNALTAIVCTVNPCCSEQTLRTLQFASSAKNIQNTPKVNKIVTSDAQIRRYNMQIEELKGKGRGLEGSMLTKTLQEKNSQIDELKKRVRSLEKKLLVSTLLQTSRRPVSSEKADAAISCHLYLEQLVECDVQTEPFATECNAMEVAKQEAERVSTGVGDQVSPVKICSVQSCGVQAFVDAKDHESQVNTSLADNYRADFGTQAVMAMPSGPCCGVQAIPDVEDYASQVSTSFAEGYRTDVGVQAMAKVLNHASQVDVQFTRNGATDCAVQCKLLAPDDDIETPAPNGVDCGVQATLLVQECATQTQQRLLHCDLRDSDVQAAPSMRDSAVQVEQPSRSSMLHCSLQTTSRSICDSFTQPERQVPRAVGVTCEVQAVPVTSSCASQVRVSEEIEELRQERSSMQLCMEKYKAAQQWESQYKLREKAAKKREIELNAIIRQLTNKDGETSVVAACGSRVAAATSAGGEALQKPGVPAKPLATESSASLAQQLKAMTPRSREGARLVYFGRSLKEQPVAGEVQVAQLRASAASTTQWLASAERRHPAWAKLSSHTGNAEPRKPLKEANQKSHSSAGTSKDPILDDMAYWPPMKFFMDDKENQDSP